MSDGSPEGPQWSEGRESEPVVPAPPAPALAPAPPGKRLLGAVVDGGIFFGLALLAFAGDTGPSLGLAVTWVVIHAIYEIALTAARGQTLGKMAARTMVLDQSGERLPTLMQATVRWLVPTVPNLLGLALLNANFDAVSVVWAIVVYLPILTSSDRRGWHDRVATTIVVERPRVPAQ